jgi:hypothetical protein
MAKKKEVDVVEEARPDEAVLPDEFTFKLPVSQKEITIHPWSWGTYTKIAPSVDKIFEIVDSSNLNVAELGSIIKLQDKIHPKLFSGEEIDPDVLKEYNDSVKSANYIMVRLMAKLSDLIVPVLESSTELTEEEILSLNPTDIHTLVMSVYYVNPTVLGNVYQPFAQEDAEGLGEKKK